MKTNKQFFSLFIFIVVVSSILFYKHKTDAETVKVKIGQSSHFSKDEIKAAVSTVKEKFKGYKGCSLTELKYSEKDSLAIAKDYMNFGGGDETVVGDKNVIVLLSNFKVDSSGGDGSWKPNSTQTRYTWTLIRNSEKGKWRVAQAEDNYTDANNVKVSIGRSKKLTKEDIITAFDTVKKDFKKDKNNEGCTITELHYSEFQAIDADTIESYMEDKNAIVVFSTIKTAPTAVGGWDANKTMDNFSWTLVRDSSNGKWRVKDGGYALDINLFFLTNAML
ncbi:hypothetical protein CN692_21100 [Bacillus sp. AFS002410]|uniref:hypothetical protein n=1 Tax=Bacillus sp. AFS002410 TaxID=2033481 RepID=UPI000BF0AD40|nr:hypothetical protein [Bacillus sp. AFS002410]PEJ53808.1 hypothetical protein CN692_21100 [Bacillus sp. AFS002410]